jgi:hypothetical protein
MSIAQYSAIALLTMASIMCCARASAQNGVWQTDDTDGYDIDTDLFASPAYYPPPPACPRGIDTSTYFNGVWGNAHANYPHTTSLFEQVRSAGQGEYYWQTNFVDYGTVNHGLCGIVYYSPYTELWLSIATTWAQTVQDNGAGKCTVIPDCAPGVTPICPQANPQRWTVIETDGGACDPFHATYWLAHRTGSKTAPRRALQIMAWRCQFRLGPAFALVISSVAPIGDES